MSKRFMILGLIAAAGLVAFQPWSATPRARSPEAVAPASLPDDVYQRRVFEIASLEPRLERAEIDHLIEQSDRIREQIAESGDESLGDAVRRRLSEVEITGADALAYYAAHRDLFGRRCFEVSRHTVERLIAIDRVRAELGLE